MPQPKKLPETLTSEEQSQLLKIPNPKAPTGLRNLCMLRLMLDTGLRVSEVIHLRPRDVDWMSGKVMVRQGKGKKDRTLWVNEDLLDLLRRWKVKRPEAEFFFTTLQAQPLNDRYMRAMVERIAAKAGIDKPIHPHSLRHTFATDLLKETKNIRMVQKALGHSNLSTTMIYTHVIDDEMEAALKTFRR